MNQPSRHLDARIQETQRLQAWGDQMIQMHNVFRADLAALRHDTTPRPGTGGDLGVALRTRCLTFCEQLHAHHSMEDEALFPHLSAEHPELATVLDRLRREHTTVAWLLAKIETTVADEHPTTRPESGPELHSELHRLADELEAHLTYEEEQLVPVLNRLTSLPEQDIREHEQRLGETAETLLHRARSA